LVTLFTIIQMIYFYFPGIFGNSLSVIIDTVTVFFPGTIMIGIIILCRIELYLHGLLETKLESVEVCLSICNILDRLTINSNPYVMEMLGNQGLYIPTKLILKVIDLLKPQHTRNISPSLQSTAVTKVALLVHRIVKWHAPFAEILQPLMLELLQTIPYEVEVVSAALTAIPLLPTIIVDQPLLTKLVPWIEMVHNNAGASFHIDLPLFAAIKQIVINYPTHTSSISTSMLDVLEWASFTDEQQQLMTRMKLVLAANGKATNADIRTEMDNLQLSIRTEMESLIKIYATAVEEVKLNNETLQRKIQNEIRTEVDTLRIALEERMRIDKETLQREMYDAVRTEMESLHSAAMETMQEGIAVEAREREALCMSMDTTLRTEMDNHKSEVCAMINSALEEMSAAFHELQQKVEEVRTMETTVKRLPQASSTTFRTEMESAMAVMENIPQDTSRDSILMEDNTVGDGEKGIEVDMARGPASQLLEAINVITKKIGRNRSRMMISLNSGEIASLVVSLESCTAIECQQVVLAAFKMVRRFARYGDDAIKSRLVAIPGLLSSLASLCDEEILKKNPDNIVEYIIMTAIYLSGENSAAAAALVEAGWADLLVKSLGNREDDKGDVDYASGAIYTLLLFGPSQCKSAFIAAGAELALEETIKRHLTDGDVVRSYCIDALKILKKGV